MSSKPLSALRLSVVVLAVLLLAGTADAAYRVHCIRNVAAGDVQFSWRLENEPQNETCNDPAVQLVAGDSPAQIATKWAASVNANCTGGGGGVLAASATVLTAAEVGDLCQPGYAGAFRIDVDQGFSSFVGEANVSPPSDPCNCAGGLNPDSCEPGEQSFGRIPPSPDFCNFNPDVGESAVTVPTLGRWGLIGLALLLAMTGSILVFLRRA